NRAPWARPPSCERRTAPAGGGGRLCGERPGAGAAGRQWRGDSGVRGAGRLEEGAEDAVEGADDLSEEVGAGVDGGRTGGEGRGTELDEVQAVLDAAHGESFRCPAVACPPPGCSSHAYYTRDAGGRSVFFNHMRPRSHFRRRNSPSRPLDGHRPGVQVALHGLRAALGTVAGILETAERQLGGR